MEKAKKAHILLALAVAIVVSCAILSGCVSKGDAPLGGAGAALPGEGEGDLALIENELDSLSADDFPEGEENLFDEELLG